MGSLKLTKAQTDRIRELRSQGVGYRLIAQELDISRDTVRYYCKTHGLDGFAEEQMPSGSDDGHCLQCGSEIQQPESGRKRRFCSDACRWKWWHEHGEEVMRPAANRQEVVCVNCGKPFSAYKSKGRKYCSHACYIRDRFWRLEDGREPYISPSKSSDLA